ncbi:MAG: hypothetical protein KDA44_21580, partial [Planctomycetales bacterium]|nr:hypothetical protein [Planctomycetales bacterium]
KQLAGAGGDAAAPAAVKSKPASGALDYAAKKAALAETGRLLSLAPLAVPERVAALAAEVGQLEQQLAERAAAGPLTGDALIEKGEKIADVTVICTELPGVDPNLMRQLIDQVRQKASPAAVLLATRQGDDKVTLVAGISKDLQQRGVSAGKWIGPVAKAVGGGGGGRPDLAQAGGKEPAKLPEALQVARSTIAAMLQG